MKESEEDSRGRRAANKLNGIFKVVVVAYGHYSKYTCNICARPNSSAHVLLPCEFSVIVCTVQVLIKEAQTHQLH